MKHNCRSNLLLCILNAWVEILFEFGWGRSTCAADGTYCGICTFIIAADGTSCGICTVIIGFYWSIASNTLYVIHEKIYILTNELFKNNEATSTISIYNLQINFNFFSGCSRKFSGCSLPSDIKIKIALNFKFRNCTLEYEIVYVTNIYNILYILIIWFNGHFSNNADKSSRWESLLKGSLIQCGYRKWGTRVRVSSQTLAHGNSKNKIS